MRKATPFASLTPPPLGHLLQVHAPPLHRGGLKAKRDDRKLEVSKGAGRGLGVKGG